MLKMVRNEIFGEMIGKRKAQYDPNNLNGFIDELIHLSQSNNIYSPEIMVYDVSAMFAAGTHTTSRSLEAAIYCAALFSDIQEEVYNELIQVAEEDEDDSKDNNNNKYKWYSLKHSDKCPKLKAFLHESLRYIPIGPLGIQHSCTEDVNVNIDDKLYIIPKDSVVMANIEYLSFCQKSWGDDADKFSLDRWLTTNDDDKKQLKFVLNDNELAFSVGRRNCVGKSLALKNLEMAIANWVLNYSFQWNDKYPKKIDKKFGLIYELKSIPLIISKRC